MDDAIESQGQDIDERGRVSACVTFVCCISYNPR